MSALALAGAQVAGGLFSAYSNYQQNQQNIGFQRDLAQQGISWATQDLKNAGLNPILTATQGVKPTVGGGSNISMPNPMEGISSAYKAGEEAELVNEQTQKTKAETDYINIQSGKVTAEEAKIRQEIDKVKKEIKLIQSQTLKTVNDSQVSALDAKTKELRLAVEEIDNAIYSEDWATALRLLEKPGVAGSMSALGMSYVGYKTALKRIISMEKQAALKVKASKNKLEASRNWKANRARNRRRSK